MLAGWPLAGVCRRTARTLRIAASIAATSRPHHFVGIHHDRTADALSSLMAFVALSALEIVLGVDNLVFIAILTGRLPPEKRALGRQLGLGLAAGGRIMLLFAASWVMTLDESKLVHDRRMGSHDPRSDPHRRRIVPAGQGDVGDSQQSRRRTARSDGSGRNGERQRRERDRADPAARPRVLDRLGADGRRHGRAGKIHVRADPRHERPLAGDAADGARPC